MPDRLPALFSMNFPLSFISFSLAQLPVQSFPSQSDQTYIVAASSIDFDALVHFLSRLTAI
jgi:hypothetical protein